MLCVYHKIDSREKCSGVLKQINLHRFYEYKKTAMMRISILTYFLLISLSNAVTKHCHGDRCFWLSDTTQGTQSQGRTACQSEGGDLAVMETEELYNFVASNLRLVICTTNILRGCFARQITRELTNLILKKYYFL